MIYVNFKIPKTPREFLKKLFSFDWYGNYITTVKTYKDPECTKIQCGTYKRRSFDDILECSQTYFPKIDHKKLFKLLITLKITNKQEGRDYNLYMFNCSDIRRIVMLYAIDLDPIYSYRKGIESKKYQSKYSWKELLEEIDIKDEQSFIKLSNNKK